MALTPAPAVRRPKAADPGGAALVRANPDDTPGRYRVVDILSLLYYGLTAALLLHPDRPAAWPGILALHGLVLVGVPLAVRFGSRSRVVAFLRDWYPMAALILLYGELKDLNQVLQKGYFDPLVIAWEDGLFGRQLCMALRGWMPWKPVGEILHFGYFSYYFMLPALFPALYVLKRRREFRISAAVVLGTYYFCYLCYVFFPVTGPYWQFPQPDPSGMGWFFPQLTHGIVAGGSSRGSAFPSSHIAASVAVLGMAWHTLRPVFFILLLPVTLLTIATMYGGFHYGVDAAAGLLVGLLAAWLGPKVVRRFEPE
jgi:membrane-associated phospholipid phosphatase